jgi:hypothetical protein
MDHQTANPRVLDLRDEHVIPTDAVNAVEAQLHRRFATNRVNGEWFQFEAEVEFQMAVDEAKKLANQMSELAPIFDKAEQYSRATDNGAKVSADEYSLALGSHLVIARSQIKVCLEAEKTLKSLLGEALSRGDDIQEAAKEQTRTISPKFDQSAFRDDHPELFKEFATTSEVISTRFLINTKFRGQTLDEATQQTIDFSADIQNIVEAAKTFVAEGQFSMTEDLIGQLTRQRALADWEDSISEAKLKVACGENYGLEGLCTWRREQKLKEDFDEVTFQEKYPDVYYDYLSDPVTKKFIRLNRMSAK